MRSHEQTVQRPTVLLDHYLKQLRLPTVLREYKTEAARCAKEGEDYVAFLARLCEGPSKNLPHGGQDLTSSMCCYILISTSMYGA
jgi:hypothetical protein